MRRREFTAFIAGAIVIWTFAAMGQEAGRIYHEGVVSPIPCEVASWNAGRYDELARHGFIRGQNFTVEAKTSRSNAAILGVTLN